MDAALGRSRVATGVIQATPWTAHYVAEQVQDLRAPRCNLVSRQVEGGILMASGQVPAARCCCGARKRGTFHSPISRTGSESIRGRGAPAARRFSANPTHCSISRISSSSSLCAQMAIVRLGGWGRERQREGPGRLTVRRPSGPAARFEVTGLRPPRNRREQQRGSGGSR